MFRPEPYFFAVLGVETPVRKTTIFKPGTAPISRIGSTMISNSFDGLGVEFYRGHTKVWR